MKKASPELLPGEDTGAPLAPLLFQGGCHAMAALPTHSGLGLKRHDLDLQRLKKCPITLREQRKRGMSTSLIASTRQGRLKSFRKLLGIADANITPILG